MSPTPLRRIYHHLLKLYPAGFRAEYGEEIQMVFEQALESQTRLVCLAGWSGASWSARRLCCCACIGVNGAAGISGQYLSTTDLPTHDGRHSWGLAGVESLFFLAWAGLLVLLTYSDLIWLRPGWFRDLSLAGGSGGCSAAANPAAGPGRGLPRWVYPFYGLQLAYLWLCCLALPTGVDPGGLSAGIGCPGVGSSLGKHPPPASDRPAAPGAQPAA